MKNPLPILLFSSLIIVQFVCFLKDPDFLKLSRLFLHLHPQNELHHDDEMLHFYQDENGDLFPLKMKDKLILDSSGRHHLPNPRALPLEQNDKLSIHFDNIKCKLLQLHSNNQNIHCEGNYDIAELPNLSSNSYSSLSLNSAG